MEQQNTQAVDFQAIRAQVDNAWQNDLVERSIALRTERTLYEQQNGIEGITADAPIKGLQEYAGLEQEVTPVTPIESRRPGKLMKATAVVGMAVLAACSHTAPKKGAVSRSASSGAYEISAAQLIDQDGDLDNAIQGGVKEVTDADLAHGGFNCGHTIEGMDVAHYDYSNQIDYLNQHPDLIKHLLNFQINDNRYGLGQEAWDVLMNKSYSNSDTPDAKTIDPTNDNAEGDMNTYAHKIHTIELQHPHDFLNFTCTDAQGRQVQIRVVSLIKVTGHANGFVLNDADLKDFMAKVKRYEDGTPVVDTFDAGMQEVNGEKVHVTLVSTESAGCLNPNRALPPKARQPQTPHVTTPPATTPPGTTPPGTTPPTTHGARPKTDPNIQAGPNATPGTTQPAPEGPPTPDHGEPNPVGGTTTTSAPASPGTTIKAETSPSTTASTAPPTTQPPLPPG